MVSADVTVPLDGAGAGTATVTLHDARVFGQSWERLVLGAAAGAVPVLPEARTLLAGAVQRVATDVAGQRPSRSRDLLTALGLIGPTGGLAADALDQLVHDAGGLVRQRLALAGADVSAAVTALLGPVAASVDLDARTVHDLRRRRRQRTLRLARRRHGEPDGPHRPGPRSGPARRASRRAGCSSSSTWRRSAPRCTGTGLVRSPRPSPCGPTRTVPPSPAPWRGPRRASAGTSPSS